MTMSSKQRWLLVGGVGLALVFVLFVMVSRRHADTQKAAEKLLSADAMHVKTELLINLPERFRGQERPFTKVMIRLDGEVARAGDQTPEFTGSLYLEARGRGNVFFADGQGRILKDRVLFNLDNVPVFLNPSGSLVKRWVKVEASLLTARHSAHVREVLAAGFRNLQRTGLDTVDGEKLVRYSGTFSEEQEQQMADVLRQDVSGSPALHTLARLLNTNQVKTFDVWIDGSAQEIRRVRVHFVRPVRPAQGEPFDFDFATLTMAFTDYGKEVAIDVPEARRVVKPEVFARLFGTGNVEAVAR